MCIVHCPSAQCACQKSTALEKIDFSLSHFTPSKKKNELWSEEIRILIGVKNGKKKKFILEHVMYTYIFDNEFFTFPFYPWQEKKWKALKWWNMHLSRRKKNSTALKKKIYHFSHLTPGKKKKWKTLKWGNMHLDRGKKWKKKKRSSIWGTSCIRTFLTMDFSLSCFSPIKKKIKSVEVRKYASC
jgi:hypothetical protein